MKLWMNNTKITTHHIVKLHAEEHSSYEYVGDLDDAKLREFLLNLQQDMDVDKNIKLLNYYGYLHLFIKQGK